MPIGSMYCTELQPVLSMFCEDRDPMGVLSISERICRTKMACPSFMALLYYKKKWKLFPYKWGSRISRKEYIEVARYLISEAARQTGVEAHVLRFWEEELKLEIPRNEQGHRYYTEDHIQVFEAIKNMKLQGLPLKVIKDSLEQKPETANAVAEGQAIPAQMEGEGEKHISIPISFAESRHSGELSRQDKLVEFESIIYDIVTEALRNNNEHQVKDISDRVGDKVVKEMNYLMRENEEQLEAHFRKLDEALLRRGRRSKEKSEREAALTKVTKLPVVSQTRKKRRLFPRRRKTTLY